MTQTKTGQWFNLRIDPITKKRLEVMAQRSGQSMSAVIRQLIEGTPIRELPPVDYREMVAELHKIGNNLNQIARTANASGRIQDNAYQWEAQHLREAIVKIRKAIELR